MMPLQRGDHLKRGRTYLTVLSVSPCGRYGVVAWAKGRRIVEERVSLTGLRRGRYNATKHAVRWYQEVRVLES